MDRGSKAVNEAQGEILEAAQRTGLSLADAVRLAIEGGPHLLGLLAILARIKQGPAPPPQDEDTDQGGAQDDEESAGKEAPKPAQTRRPHPR